MATYSIQLVILVNVVLVGVFSRNTGTVADPVAETNRGIAGGRIGLKKILANLRSHSEKLRARDARFQDKSPSARGVLDKLTGEECKFYGQHCNAVTLNFCCGNLKCLRNSWYSPAGLCRFDWEK